MAHHHPTDPEAPVPLYRRPWPLVGFGLALAVLVWWQPQAWREPPDWVSGPWRFLTLALATVSLFTAAVFRLRAATWDLPARVESAAVVSLGGIGALIGTAAVDQEWVSGKVLFWALFILCVVATVLILLPPLARRVAISLILLFHFAGMATAVTLVDPPGDSGPWLSKQLWSRVYRPYLSFLYLTNAYHFYSPNPGPPALLWFAVHYDDGSYSWLKIPDRGHSPVGMHYQRMLALPEHSFAAVPRLPMTELELGQLNLHEGKKKTVLPHGTWEQIYRRRYQASLRPILYAVKDSPGEGLPIPFIREEDMSLSLQYREPTIYSKRILSSVVRRVFQDAPVPREGVKVRSIKLYRVVANILSPAELAAGMDPWEKTKHMPHFLGEFNSDGQLIDAQDPFLYWYLPILWVPKDYPDDALSRSRRDVPAGSRLSRPLPSLRPFAPAPKDGFLLDALEMHAAGPLYLDKPDKGKAAKENK